MGRRKVIHTLNPKPGMRVPCFHSMGLQSPCPLPTAMKALIAPVILHGGRTIPIDTPDIHIQTKVEAA